MNSNLYPIQLKNRVLFILLSGILRILVIYLVVVNIFRVPPEDVATIHEIRYLMALFVALPLGVFLVIQIITNILTLKSLQYSFDDKNVIFKGGIFSRFEKVIPYSKIQHVILIESFRQRILGLSSLHIQTAGLMLPGIYIPDLRKDDATKLMNYINSLVIKSKPVAGI